VNRYNTAPLGLSDEERRQYRKTARAIGIHAAREAMGLPPAELMRTDDPLLQPIINGDIPRIAVKAGVTASTIYQWRQGKNPSLHQLMRALRVCGFRLQLVPIYEDAAE